MNTHLHLLEAYTNLLEVWPNRGLQIKIRELIKIMLDKILDAKNSHFHLFFDEQGIQKLIPSPLGMTSKPVGWFYLLSRQGLPIADYYKVGPWKCPYHNSRACLEVISRLS